MTGARLATWGAGLCGWAVFMPIGVKYPALLLCAGLCLHQLWRSDRLGDLGRDTGFRLALAFWAWVAASLLWTSAPPALAWAQVGIYGLLLLVPVMALGLPQTLGAVALRQFGIAAAVIGLAQALAAGGWLPATDTALWRWTVHAEGNQRIVTSLLLALGAAVSLLQMLQTREASRWAWLLAASLAVLGLALQDRRTGMVTLPLLLAVLALSRPQALGRRLVLLALIAATAAAAWQFVPGVRQRFDEGVAELQHYPASDTVATSWGMRLRLYERTLDMTQERPLLGHGVGSWVGQWQARVPAGLPISAHTTPHNEYLLVAAQFGLPGLGLLLLCLGAFWAGAWRAGPAQAATLLVWTALLWSGLFNAALRDAKFGVPLLLLAGLAAARFRPR